MSLERAFFANLEYGFSSAQSLHFRVISFNSNGFASRSLIIHAIKLLLVRDSLREKILEVHKLETLEVNVQILIFL